MQSLETQLSEMREHYNLKLQSLEQTKKIELEQQHKAETMQSLTPDEQH